jgi:predicted enzyme related to lactoylglutathione lyase
VYFAVDDVNAAHSKIKELGGTPMMDPFAVEHVGTMVVASDPQGAMFAVIQLDGV